jgi:type VI secretion system secreted protein VgrG
MEAIMANAIAIEGRSLRISGPAIQSALYFIRGEVREELSTMTEIDVEFLSRKPDLKPTDILGQSMTIELDLDKDGKKSRYWHGNCIECTYIGVNTVPGLGEGRFGHFRAKLRPKLWYLTRTSDCRIFQEMKVDDIIKEVFRDNGLSDYTVDIASRDVKNYCVQYRETDFDFVSRLMEEEGIFYFFKHEDGKETMVLCDDSAGLSAIDGEETIEFKPNESQTSEKFNHIYLWEQSHRIKTSTVTLADYDFEKPATEVKGTRKAKAKGEKSKEMEFFDYPGRFADSGEGVKVARRQLEALTSETERSTGEGLVRNLSVGATFKFKSHPTNAINGEYLVLSARHILKLDDDDVPSPTGAGKGEDEETYNAHVVKFEVQEKSVPYQTLRKTARPEIPGVQTAVVVGPDGEEIHVDEHARIKVQFHWDRYGKNDDNSSCWIRVATPISGKGWGTFAVPRIDQEVIVQFEEGDPDRPMVTGMVFNGDNKVPFAFPDNKTQIGMMSNSTIATKKGFHELVFEDKLDAEFVRMQSEKDFLQTIKNNSEINYGTGDKDEGDLTEKVWRHTKLEYGVGSGEGNLSQTVEVDFKETVKKGDYTLDISTGNRAVTIASDDSLDVTGKITIEAKQSIELICGQSVIKMTPSGIEISSVEITVEGQASVDAKSPTTTVEGSAMMTVKGTMTEVKGDAMLTLKGGIVMIN